MCNSYVPLLAVSTGYKMQQLENCEGSSELLFGYWKMQKFFSDVVSCVGWAHTLNRMDPSNRRNGQFYEINSEYEQAK